MRPGLETYGMENTVYMVECLVWTLQKHVMQHIRLDHNIESKQSCKKFNIQAPEIDVTIQSTFGSPLCFQITKGLAVRLVLEVGSYYTFRSS